MIQLFRPKLARTVSVLCWSLIQFVGGASTAGEMLTFGGQTMGTSYMVKVYDPPIIQRSSWDEAAKSEVDRELREVNDQMSTYLKTSEISMFNDSKSTDWFEVSPETSTVVSFAQQVAEATDGAFDVTVGPLVDRWSFGIGERAFDVPGQAELDQLLQSVGYKKLHVRLDPPSLRKDVSSLRVDLSAIAKGHGVDRVVETLIDLGAMNVFVEIGGEVRVAGSKDGVPWKVGIQRPDVEGIDVLAAHPMTEGAMATSGDYRNFFDKDGQRFSHTMDPRSGRPVGTTMASVSVISPTCMEADAWATALMAVGVDQAQFMAQRLELDTVLVSRGKDGLDMVGTGSLQAFTSIKLASSIATSSPTSGNFAERFFPVAVLTLVGLGMILIAMAVGVLFGRKSISGSCGGLNAKTDPDGTSRCSMCSNPSDACQELREKMASSKSSA